VSSISLNGQSLASTFASSPIPTVPGVSGGPSAAMAAMVGLVALFFFCHVFVDSYYFTFVFLTTERNPDF
jgi:hypothetical protein